MAKSKVINGLLPETPDEVVPVQAIVEQEISEEVVTTEVPVQAGHGSRDLGKTRN